MKWVRSYMEGNRKANKTANKEGKGVVLQTKKKTLGDENVDIKTFEGVNNVQYIKLQKRETVEKGFTPVKHKHIGTRTHKHTYINPHTYKDI